MSKELIELQKKAKFYSDNYYNKGISLISDYEFDMLVKQIAALEREEGISKDSITQTVGAQIEGAGRRHGRPMLSLMNTYTKDDVKSWVEACQLMGAKRFICELKFDGCSFAARYENGKIVQALSRGDGEVGEDLTNNLANSKTFVIRPNGNDGFTGEVRGEIMMMKAELERINETRPEGSKYANPRNLVSGTLKLLDVNEFDKRNLFAEVYWLEDDSPIENLPMTQTGRLEYLSEKGFNVSKWSKTVDTLEDIMKYIEFVEKQKDLFQFEIDGVVIKVDDCTLWDKMGSTSKSPRWATSFKFQEAQYETVVNSIDWQVGRTGALTPVANLEPITFEGSTVSRATLSNIEQVHEKDVRIGDHVFVRKAKAVIPEIASVNFDKRTNQVKTELPTVCPVCGGEIGKLNEEHVASYCLNPFCDAKLPRQIKHFTKTLEIDGLGPKIIEQLVDAEIVTCLADLYELHTKETQCLALERFGKKLFDKIVTNIEGSKTQPFWRFLASLGIKDCGKRMSKVVNGKYHNFKELQSAVISDLTALESIGDIMAESIVKGVKDESKLSLMESFDGFLFNNTAKEVFDKIGDALVEMAMTMKDQVVCMTGSFNNRSRKEYEELIEQRGGKVANGVTSKTTLLVNNDLESKSSKNVKAQQLGVKILSEEDFCNILFD